MSPAASFCRQGIDARGEVDAGGVEQQLAGRFDDIILLYCEKEQRPQQTEPSDPAYDTYECSHSAQESAAAKVQKAVGATGSRSYDLSTSSWSTAAVSSESVLTCRILSQRGTYSSMSLSPVPPQHGHLGIQPERAPAGGGPFF